MSQGFVRSARLILCLFVTLIFTSTITHAEHPFAIELSINRAEVDHSNFRDSSGHSIVAAYTSNTWVYRLGAIELREFELRNAPRDSHIAISGTTAQIHHSWPLGQAQIEAGGGIIYYTATATFGGNRLTKERDFSPLVDARIAFPLTQRLHLHLGYSHLFDVSGSDLSNLHLGLTGRF